MSTAPAVAETVLKVEGLTTTVRTRRGVFKAVEGIGFELKRGETLGLVGESGSGKSLTGLSLLRLAPKPAAEIAAGRVELNGRDIMPLGEEEMRRVRGGEISMILQDPQSSLNPSFTVGRQIMEAIRLHRKVPREGLGEAAVDALRQVRIAAPEYRVKAYPHQMSGGMKQRAVGAIAVSCGPSVIVADEPTTSLDVTVQAQYLRLLEGIQKESGLALIFITHDFGIVARICHRLAVMYAGQIVETGSTKDVFARPAHPYTEALLGSVPKLHGHSGRLPSIEGQPPALWDMPKGCRFAPRCRYAFDKCREAEPPSFPVPSAEGGQAAKCWKLAS